ncbi:MAG: Fe-S cluster assembly protein NifU, partial [Deltaproteobacteria bacterium]|nr:Fe-S cluster assembly protein NifU [Deltaproteobacteria bacterium]
NCNGEEKVIHELDGEVICKCYGVTDNEIKKVAQENKLHSMDEITNYTKAGGGCGQCVDKIQSILDNVNVEPKTRAKESQSPLNDGLTNIQRIHLIEKMIDERIRPALHQDSGDIELVDVNNETVYVRLKGACATCPSSSNTLRRFVEKEIQKEISPYLKVEEVKT